MITGYSIGGEASCHAVWTRPHIYGRGVCSSSALWWPRFRLPDQPDNYFYYGQFYFNNVTLPAYAQNRQTRQRILLDVGELEEDFSYDDGVHVSE